MVHAALGWGARLVVSTDAHAVAEPGFMHWGVDQARRGWAGKDQVANTRSIESLLRLLRGSRR
ncbi:MAG TPA: hypothetical protein VFZ26_03440 [Gemmatimonadales bacterium]